MPIIEESWINEAKALGFDSEREMLHDLYIIQHFSINEIAKVLGFAAFTVRRRLLENSVPLRTRGGPNKLGKRALRDVPDSELFETPYEELASRHKVTISTVYAERKLRRLCNSVQ